MTAAHEDRKILAVTDLGPAGDAAVRAAAARAHALGAELAVVHVMQSLEMVRPVFAEHLVDDALRQATLPEQLRHVIAQRLAALAPQVPGAEIFLESGGSAEHALQVADRWSADLVVIGAPEDGAVDAARIVRHANVPVMVVRDGPATGPVVACTDFSDPALPAVRAAAEEARRTGDKLYVVHALEPLPVAMLGVEGYGIVVGSDYQRERRQEAERRLAAALAEVDVVGEYVAVDGPVVSSLATAARDLGARLLVMGTVGRTGLTRFLLGSVAEALLRAAPCSALVVRLRQGAR